MPVYLSNVVMSIYQVSVTASPDDIDGTFRTSLRASSPPRKASTTRNPERSSSTTRTASTTTKTGSTSISIPDDSLLGVRSINRSGSSNRDSVFDSLDSYRSSSFTSGPSRNRADTRQGQSQSQRQPRGTARSRTRSRPNSRANGYDASLHGDAPMVSRYNQSGEVYTPVSHAWQAFKERLFDSSLSEKYETLRVNEPARSNRRYRSVSPGGLEDEDLYDEQAKDMKKLLFLQDPLARSMYRNLETFFDRKNIIRDAAGPSDLLIRNSAPATARGNFSRQSSGLFNQSDGLVRANSSLDLRTPLTARSLDPPRSQSSMETRSAASSFFGRRKKEQPLSSRAHSEERPEDVRKQIQQRFAKINFDEGTTDYDALFTVSEEGGDIVGLENGDPVGSNAQADHHEHGGAVDKDETPKSKLDHLRY